VTVVIVVADNTLSYRLSPRLNAVYHASMITVLNYRQIIALISYDTRDMRAVGTRSSLLPGKQIAGIARNKLYGIKG